jgi:type VI secretion system secreted protein Hcp
MAVFDAFIKFDGIDGESTDKVHPNEIEISSFSWGVSNAGNVGGGTGGGGKAVLQDFHFAMGTSKASPNLMLACATGHHFQLVTLTCRRGGAANGVEFLKIKLADCLVSSYSLGGDNTPASANSSSPLDQVSVNFVKIDFLYTVARTGETVEAIFDGGRPN